MKLFGPVLTHVNGINSLWELKVREPRINTIKVITGWGLTWDSRNIARVNSLFPHIIVRTTYGDPSYGRTLPTYNQIREELLPWLDINPFAYVEIGNEPNVADVTEAWGYKWYLTNAAVMLKLEFPHIQLIAPGMMMKDNAARWHDIFRNGNNENVYDHFDYLGVHVYGFKSMYDSDQIQYMAQLYKDVALPWLYTEFGIHTYKGIDRMGNYYSFIEDQDCAGGTYFHICEDKKILPEYHLL